MLAMLLANLGWGTIVGWSLWLMGVNSAVGGLLPGAILGGLITFSMDMYLLAMSNMYANTTIIVVDVLVNVCMSAVLDAVAGLSGAIASFRIRNNTSADVAKYLFEQDNIFTVSRSWVKTDALGLRLPYTIRPMM